MYAAVATCGFMAGCQYGKATSAVATKIGKDASDVQAQQQSSLGRTQQ